MVSFKTEYNKIQTIGMGIYAGFDFTIQAMMPPIPERKHNPSISAYILITNSYDKWEEQTIRIYNL